MQITVYCASSRKAPEQYFEATRRLANSFIKENVKVRYGGGAVGLMGALADEYLAGNGEIIGIIPEFMVKVEWAHPGLKELLVVHDMAERKKLLMQDSDAVVALPGGSGTLEELMEVFSLKRLGKYLKPIILLNVDGFYDHLIAFTEKMIDEKFMREEHRQIWKVVNNPEDALDAIRNAPNWDNDALERAGV